MEGELEKPKFEISNPRQGDAAALAEMLNRSWKETYIPLLPGFTEEMVDHILEYKNKTTEPENITIDRSLNNPNEVLYKVVRNSKGEVVGFVHGTQRDDRNELEGIYLLNEAKNSGTGRELMNIFLKWADPSKPCRLDVFSFNEAAIKFYEAHGFEMTETLTKFYNDNELLEYIEMVRPPEDKKMMHQKA